MCMEYVKDRNCQVVYSTHVIKGACEVGQKLVREVPDPGQLKKSYHWLKMVWYTISIIFPLESLFRINFYLMTRFTVSFPGLRCWKCGGLFWDILGRYRLNRFYSFYLVCVFWGLSCSHCFGYLNIDQSCCRLSSGDEVEVEFSSYLRYYIKIIVEKSHNSDIIKRKSWAFNKE